MKKALALILCLIMVAALAVSAISADETKVIDSRELQEYGQLHFWLGDPATGTAIPNVEDGKVSENEYQASFEATVESANETGLNRWSDHDKDASGNLYGKYWDNEWAKFYVSYDEETIYFGYETKDKNFVAGKERVVHMISMWDVGTTPGAVGRINFWGDAMEDGTVNLKIQNFRKAEDGGWNWSEKLAVEDYCKAASCSYNESTQILSIEMSIDLVKVKEWWGNDLDLEDVRMYWAPYGAFYGESVEGAGDTVCQGLLWCYLKGEADTNIKLGFLLDYPEITYWGGPMFFPHIVHFCEEPEPTTPAPTTTAAPTTTPEPTTAAPTTAKPTTAAPTTAAPTDAPVATTTAAPKDEGGCGGTIALSALALVPMLGAAVVFGKKKED